MDAKCCQSRSIGFMYLFCHYLKGNGWLTVKKTRNYNEIVVEESQLKIGFGCFWGCSSSGLKLFLFFLGCFCLCKGRCFLMIQVFFSFHILARCLSGGMEKSDNFWLEFKRESLFSCSYILLCVNVLHFTKCKSIRYVYSLFGFFPCPQQKWHSGITK